MRWISLLFLCIFLAACVNESIPKFDGYTVQHGCWLDIYNKDGTWSGAAYTCSGEVSSTWRN